MSEPWDADSEASVLGACMISPKAVERSVEILDGREFYLPTNGYVFKAISSLYEKGVDVDALTVVEELTTTGLLSQVEGGGLRIHELSAIVPAAGNVKHYCHIVRENWVAREVARMTGDLQREALERSLNSRTLVERADEMALELSTSFHRDKDAVFTGKQLADRFRYRVEHPEEFESTVEPPFTFLRDQIVNGQLHILAGYQGVGKTALVWQFATAAAEAGKKVGIWTLEMTPDQLGDRFITSHGVPSVQVRKGQVAGEYQGKLTEALTALEKLDVEIINDSHVSPESIRRRQRKAKYDLILIDHLHRFPIKNPAHIRVELSEAVRKITNVAIESNVPIILLSQLTRGTQHDPFPRPSRVQLKETGAIENDAALIWFIHRKWVNGAFEGEAELICDKNRFGSPGWWRLHFRASQVRFTESLI